MAYRHIVFADDYMIFCLEGMKTLLKALKAAGYQLGLIATTMMEECGEYDRFWELYNQFDCVIRDELSEEEPVPDGRLLKGYMERYGADRSEILHIGSNMFDMENASGAGIDCGLTMWCCEEPKHVWATCYFSQPYDIWNQLNKNTEPFKGKEWIAMAMELQFIAQTGLTYTRDKYDKERFERIREISAEAMEIGTGFPVEHVREVFCNETGFQTPKLDTRAAIFKDGRILLVRDRKSGLWSLPGGWVDVNQTIASNTVKEVKEEAGLDVVPVRLIALHDRNQHNTPPYAYGITKAFMICKVISGEFAINLETDKSGYFGLLELPELDADKTTVDQIQMCFAARENEQWIPVVD